MATVFNIISAYLVMYCTTCFHPNVIGILKERGHDFILPRVKAKRLKRASVNRCI